MKEITIEKSYSDACLIFLGFNIAKTWTMFLFLSIIEKRKDIKTHGNLIYTRLIYRPYIGTFNKVNQIHKYVKLNIQYKN
jgi:hypothetical protein